MFVAEVFCDPHDNRGVQSGPVHKSLAQMVMIGPAELVLDNDGSPDDRASIRIVGLGSFKTNKQGYAKLYWKTKGYSSSIASGISDEAGDICSIVISYGNHEEVLYEEVLAPNRSYLYEPNAAQTEGRIFVLSKLETP